MSGVAAIPSVDGDLYADETIRDSRPLFARIRDAGPVVWLPPNRLHAIGRFDDVRAALRDDATFISGRGVAANPIANRLGRSTTLNSDGDVHDRRRRILMRSLGAKALAEVQGTIDAEAERLIDDLVARKSFDAVADFGAGLPVAVVATLVGVRADHTRMLEWAAATFDALGPTNRRGRARMRTALGLYGYTRRLTRKSVAPGSWAASVFDARDRGEIGTAEARSLIIDFVAPALDTTILGSAYLLLMLARHPRGVGGAARRPRRSSRPPSSRPCASARRCARSPATSPATPRSTARRSGRARGWRSSTARPTATSGASPTPTASTCAGTAPPTSGGATDRTRASASISPSSRCRRCCARWSRASRASRPGRRSRS